jgi:hypothetical protein
MVIVIVLFPQIHLKILSKCRLTLHCVTTFSKESFRTLNALPFTNRQSLDLLDFLVLSPSFLQGTETLILLNVVSVERVS